MASHPAYHRLRYANTDALDQAKALLKEDQALLEYFVGDSSIYTFKVDKSGLDLFATERDSVSFWVSQMTSDALFDPKSAAPLLDFLPYAHKLYERLLAPIISELDTSYQRLVIIPDGEIAALPFGMLIKENQSNDFREIPFLMKDYAIGYGYSTGSFAMQKEQYNNQSLPQGSLLAVAPSFPEREGGIQPIASRSIETDSSLYRLAYTETEIKNIDVAAKKTLKGSKANPENFLELWNQYQFIHLATHAISNPSFPDEAGIAFSHEDGRTPLLRIKDLPNKPWHAKMLVLSACQTGAGQQVTGEGIISLARGFALKGIQSIVATQWSVGDFPTSQLMVKFYKNLQLGMPRDIALQKAQLSMIEGGENIKYDNGHPLYWAAFTLYGDSSPVDFPDNNFPSLPLFIGLAVLGLAWGLWRRFKR
ncbi:MAG: CHAT domain-containing protein [Bacteroidota bacterium]